MNEPFTSSVSRRQLCSAGSARNRNLESSNVVKIPLRIAKCCKNLSSKFMLGQSPRGWLKGKWLRILKQLNECVTSLAKNYISNPARADETCLEGTLCSSFSYNRKITIQIFEKFGIPVSMQDYMNSFDNHEG